MSSAISMELLSLGISLLGTLGGIFAAERLLSYRISQLEKRMEETKELVVRIYRLERQSAIHEEKLKTAVYHHNSIHNPGPT